MLKPNHSLSDTIKAYTPEAEDESKKVHRGLSDADKKKEAAKLLGSSGGKIGGVARARALTKEKRVAIARQGGLAAKRKKGKEGN